MIEKEKKLKCEKPYLTLLEKQGKTKGICLGGSSDTEECGPTGNSASGFGCFNGNSAEASCGLGAAVA